MLRNRIFLEIFCHGIRTNYGIFNLVSVPLLSFRFYVLHSIADLCGRSVAKCF